MLCWGTVQVWFAMQGEMSATVVRYPRSWTSLISKLKNDIVALRDDADQIRPNLKVGVSTNFNKLCACECLVVTFLPRCTQSQLQTVIA